MKVWLQTLHKNAQWYDTPARQRTALQRLAARTLGLVTLGNLATCMGAILVILGLLLFYRGAFGLGICMVAAGRLFDIIDGYIARKTHTSSPFGEGLDAATDKLVILCAAIIIMAMAMIPPLIMLLLVLEQAITAIVTLMARRHGILLHTTRLGKYTTFMLWVVVILYLLARGQSDSAPILSGDMLYTSANALAILNILMGAVSAGWYAVNVHKRRSGTFN